MGVYQEVRLAGVSVVSIYWFCSIGLDSKCLPRLEIEEVISEGRVRVKYQAKAQ